MGFSIDIVVWFFLIGFVCATLNQRFTVADETKKNLTRFLLIAIGLKGGIALHDHASLNLFWESLQIVALAVVLTLIAYTLLRYFGGFQIPDAASMAAHYGSVSVATFAVALHFLATLNIQYEAYFPLFLVLLEIPAILLCLLLAFSGNKQSFDKKLLKELFFNDSILLLVGASVIGYVAAPQTDKIMPVFGGGFSGVLALFLFVMGMSTARHAHQLKETGTFVISFALAMPVLGALLGIVLAHIMNLSVGGALLLATLSASASYIAAPATMTMALPSANNHQAIAASLLVTFPFNALVGIPFYYQLIPKIYAL